MSITIDRPLELPRGQLPVGPVASAVRNYRHGTYSEESVRRAIDKHGEQLEASIAHKLAQDRAEFLRLVDRLEVLAGYMATRQAQALWLRRWPQGPAPDPVPITCMLPGGHVAAVPLLLGPLHELQLERRLYATDGEALTGHRRVGASPVMAALAASGLAVIDVAHALDCSKTHAWRYLTGRVAAPAELPLALERLTGDAELAREIVVLIPARNGDR